MFHVKLWAQKCSRWVNWNSRFFLLPLFLAIVTIAATFVWKHFDWKARATLWQMNCVEFYYQHMMNFEWVETAKGSLDDHRTKKLFLKNLRNMCSVTCIEQLARSGTGNNRNSNHKLTLLYINSSNAGRERNIFQINVPRDAKNNKNCICLVSHWIIARHNRKFRANKNKINSFLVFTRI